MRIARADVEEEALSQAAAERSEAGFEVLPVPTDVANGASV